MEKDVCESYDGDDNGNGGGREGREMGREIGLGKGLGEGLEDRWGDITYSQKGMRDEKDV